MDSSLWFDKLNLEWSIVYYEGSQVIISQLNCIPFSEIVFVLANSVEFDEKLQYAAFNLGFHCLPKYAFRRG